MNEQNNINRDLCEYLVNLGEEMAKAKSQPTKFEIQGRTYKVLNGKDEEVRVRDPHKPQSKTIFTLQGLVDFIKADVDNIFQNKDFRYIVSVMSPERVTIVSPLIGQDNERHVVAECEYHADRIPFGAKMVLDDFMVMMQTRFDDTENRAKLLAVVGNMTDEQTNNVADDGVTQRITVKRGTVTNGTLSIANPAYLQAIRTFPEVEQPESPFVLRVTSSDKANDTPTMLALHECDGGAWKVSAVQTIGHFLKDALADCNVEVIA